MSSPESTRAMAGDTSPQSIPDVLAFLRAAFRAEAVGELEATYQIELEGEGDFWVGVSAGCLSCAEGRTSSAEVVVRLAASDFYDVLAARANPELLQMEERIHVEGSLSQALKLRVLFLGGAPAAGAE